MQERTVSLIVTALLLASVLFAAFFLWTIEQRATKAIALAGDAFIRLGQMNDTIAGIGTAQQSYVAPGQLDEPWFERASTLTAELSREIQQVGESLRSPEASAALRQLATSVATLTAVDARTRENLQIGQELMASDVIFSDGRNLLDAMLASLRDLQAAELAHLRAGQSGLARQRWQGLGAVAALWMGTLLLVMARLRRAAIIAVRDESLLRRSREAQAGRGEDQPIAPRPREDAQPRPEPRMPVDLAAAATVCTDLSRITTTTALPGLLRRAADVLDASGLILWISAGEQLFPVLAHGYSDDMLARMGPIARDAENAAARAWRTGQLTVVAAAPAGGQGAIVTPLFGLHHCIGVLSAELRHGEDLAVQAVATMFAAQLSTVVPAWPAGSLTPSVSVSSSEARSA
jgi:hypothetical protein